MKRFSFSKSANLTGVLGAVAYCIVVGLVCSVVAISAMNALRAQSAPVIPAPSFAPVRVQPVSFTLNPTQTAAVEGALLAALQANGAPPPQLQDGVAIAGIVANKQAPGGATVVQVSYFYTPPAPQAKRPNK